MQNDKTDLLEDVASYYSRKLAEHGTTPLGVDWNGVPGQHLRFEQLIKLLPEKQPYTLNDLGCGYGALLGYLLETNPPASYLGVDVSDEMIVAARQSYRGQLTARFITADRPDSVADFGVASGIFNVRMGRCDLQWFDYLKNTLDILDSTSRLGFAFNCLTTYSDADKMRSDLYYADPCKLFDVCKRNYSTQVALLHDYGLYEFTLLVRKVQ
ncbi:SAM-dependent methyltransferase [Pseudomonas chlororaphis]|uniref:SAM-dependent methyltransferase n=1 Tax=Pseudomonas chlororaphis TaxID=587753 RepID=A0A0A6FJH8_9PSED|nr:SAM-dependent methyltransferase [Pseudomonas chlororaphis]